MNNQLTYVMNKNLTSTLYVDHIFLDTKEREKFGGRIISPTCYRKYKKH